MSATVKADRVETPFQRFVSQFCESRLAVVGFVVMVAIILAALFAPWITPQNPYDLAQLDIMDGRLPPGSKSATGYTFLLGTDARAGTCFPACCTGCGLA